MMGKALTELLSSLNASQPIMVEQLYEFCEMNSSTDNLPGLVRMHNALQKAFAPIADEIKSVNLPPCPNIDMAGNPFQQTCGDLLYIRKRPHLKNRVLLTGHMDTVYPITHPFQQLTVIDKNRINGPGVADMKGGLIVMLHALMAFEKSPYASQLGWDVIINADEEIGSPVSGTFFEKLAKNYQAGLVYEPAMTSDGKLAKNRRGSGKFTLIATGKSAHVGRAFDEGRNAICFLAEIVSAIHTLNDKRKGVTINVGMIAGGEALNVVPNKAVAKLDIRINHVEDEAWVRDQLASIASKFNQDGYGLDIHGHFGRPVKRVNSSTEALFSRVQRLGKELGLTIDWQDSGGCCDGNNLAAHGMPVLDTLGVRGGNIHSPDEFILLDSLGERAALSTLLLIELARGENVHDDVIS